MLFVSTVELAVEKSNADVTRLDVVTHLFNYYCLTDQMDKADQVITVSSLQKSYSKSRYKHHILFRSNGFFYNFEPSEYLHICVPGHVSLVCCHIIFVYFAIFIHVLVPDDSNELCSLSHTGTIATAETSVVCFKAFHPTKTHLEGGNYCADKLLFSTGLRIAII